MLNDVICPFCRRVAVGDAKVLHFRRDKFGREVSFLVHPLVHGYKLGLQRPSLRATETLVDMGNAEGGSRTRTSFRKPDFESCRARRPTAHATPDDLSESPAVCQFTAARDPLSYISLDTAFDPEIRQFWSTCWSTGA